MHELWNFNAYPPCPVKPSTKCSTHLAIFLTSTRSILQCVILHYWQKLNQFSMIVALTHASVTLANTSTIWAVTFVVNDAPSEGKPNANSSTFLSSHTFKLPEYSQDSGLTLFWWVRTCSWLYLWHLWQFALSWLAWQTCCYWRAWAAVLLLQ